LFFLFVADEIPPDYPRRLLREGRPIDQQFSVTERLFFRIPPLQPGQEPQQVVSPDQVAGLPRTSVNRARYSKPRDVIWGRPNHGIAMLLVQEVNGKTFIDGDDRYEIRIEHDPIDDNYAHTEIRIYKNDERVYERREIDPRVRLALREIISRSARIYKTASRKE
jgi:hypothetical protein